MKITMATQAAKTLFEDFDHDDLQFIKERVCEVCKGDIGFWDSDCRFSCEGFIDEVLEYIAAGEIMSKKEEAIEILENFVAHGRYQSHIGDVALALAKLREQPPAGNFRQKVTCAILDTRSTEEQCKVALELLHEAENIIEASEATRKDLLKELEEGLRAMESEAVQCSGEWEKGLFCGLEDRNITDRYESCMFGYGAALEKVREWVLCGFEVAIAKAKEG